MPVEQAGAHRVLVEPQVVGGGDVAAEPERGLERLAQPRRLSGVLGERALTGDGAEVIGVSQSATVC